MNTGAANLADLLYDPDAPVIDRFTGQWAFLSNFHPAPLTWEGMDFATSEHAFNAGKTLNRTEREWVQCAHTPRIAKERGQEVTLREGWNDRVRYDVMAQVLRAKFLCDPRRVQALLSTGASLLIEGVTWHDQHWGTCVCGRATCAQPGQNHLGRALMTLRSEIRATRPTTQAGQGR
jgi:hypothetical protein